MKITHPRFASHPASPRRSQQGVSMIELLVAFLIFSFGMLGIAGLQTKTLAFGQSSLYRSQATALTDDILDRMRADRAHANGGDWNSPLGDKSVDITGAAVAKWDLSDWKKQVETLLPDGQASIEVTTGVVTIIVQWNEHRADSGTATDGNDFQFVTKSRL